MRLASAVITGTMLVAPPIVAPDSQAATVLTTLAYAPVTEDPFSGYPELKRICACESGLTQFHEDGTVVRGLVNRSDIGICQINEYYHGNTVQSLDLDLYTLEGNVAYAKNLYDRKGSQPWSASEGCWAS